MTNEKMLEDLRLHPDAYEELGVPTQGTGLTIEDQPKQELGIEFWLNFPIRVRPLKFVPGRNRAEKRTYRALASMEERGTLTTAKPGRGGGTLARLKKLYLTLAAAGVIKQTGAST